MSLSSGLAFSISPCKKSNRKNKDDDEVYILTLAPFTKPPKISFGTVKLNESVEKMLLIVNPQQFNVELNVTNTELNIDNIKLMIEKGAQIELKLKWEPSKPDNYKYSIQFEVLNSARLKFIVHAFGICEKPDPKKKAPIRKPLTVLQPLKTKKEEETKLHQQQQQPMKTSRTSLEQTIVMRVGNQENRQFGMMREMNHMRTHVVQKSKTFVKKYDDDFYRCDESNFNCELFDETTVQTNSYASNSTVIDRRQTNVILTPKLNLYRSIDYINVAHLNNETTSCDVTKFSLQTPLRRSTSVRDVYMDETITNGVVSNTTIVTSKITSPRTPQLADFVKTPRTMGRQWIANYEQERRVRYAIIIQRAVRMKRFRTQLRAYKLKLVETRCAIMIQRKWRMKQFRKSMSKFRQSALLIQRWFRMMLAKKQLRQLKLEAEVAHRIEFERIQLMIKVRAARLIQRWYRGIIQRRVEYQHRLLKAVVLVQSQCRMILVRKMLREKINAACLIQKWYRNKRVQRIEYQTKLNKAATVVQSQWRMILCRRNFQLKVKSACLIQKWYREIIRRRVEYQKKLLDAVVSVQSQWRMIMAQRKLRKQIRAIHVIQNWYRNMRNKRIEYQKQLLRSAIVIQSQWRMILAKRKYRLKVKSARSIQKWFRCITLRRKEYQKRLVASTICVQAQWRMIIAQRQFKLQQKSARSIQKWYRAIIQARIEYQKNFVNATICVQAEWRMIVARRKFKLYRKSACLIQNWYRTILNNRIEYQKRLVSSTIVVQTQWRMIVKRREYRRQLDAARTIQKWYRSKTDRLCYIKLQRSIVSFQFKCRQYLERRQKAASKIQAFYRMYKFRVCMNRYKLALVTIQRWTRQMQPRFAFIKLKRVVLKIQAKSREILAQKSLENACATRIQSIWRGYLVRKRLNIDQERQRNLRRSTNQSNTLGARIRHSLDVLDMPGVSISQIVTSLNELHTVTRLSPECCELFVRESAISGLFVFITSCNRSVPHMDLIKFSLDIFINLAKYSKTVNQILQYNNSFQVLLNLLQAYHITNSSIFMNVCVLLLLLHRHGCLKEEIELATEPDKINSKLTTIHTALEKRRQAVKLQPRKLNILKKVVYNLEPEWQLSKKSNLIEISDSLNALEVLLAEMGMKPAPTASAMKSSSKKFLAKKDTSQTSGLVKKPSTSARKIEYKNELEEQSTTILMNDHNISVSNVTIRSVSSFFNEEPHLNSTRNHV